MTYQEALDWIHGQLKFGIKPGLERMAWMLKELGNPQDNLKAVHIVGTNGKGSTVNALQTIFTQAGYEVQCRLQGLGELEEIRRIFVRHAQVAMEQ